MMFVEETTIPDAALPVEALKRHMRLGSGFAEDDLQNELLSSFLRAAIAAIEARTSKILLRRSFQLLFSEWSSPDRLVFPVAPVVSVEEVSLFRMIYPETDLSQLSLIADPGVVQTIDPTRYRLVRDTHVPFLRNRITSFPAIPTDGTAMVRFTAGLATTFEGLPGDMAQAVLMLAAHYDEYRSDIGLSQGCMPFGVTSLIARYTPIRMGFTA